MSVNIKYRILITSNSFGEVTDEGIKALEPYAAEIIRRPGPLTEVELMQLIKDVDAVIASHDPFTRRVIERAEKLKVIARHGIGYSEIDVEAATEKGIYVTYTPIPEEFDSVAEFTVGLILALLRKIPQADRTLKGRSWARKPFIGSMLKGKTVGIIGLGNIGRRVAKLLTPFGPTILAYDPYVSENIAKEYGARLVNLETLLKESDIITIHASLTKETRGLLGERELEIMKPGVYVINTAREPIFPRNVLLKGLRDGKIAGAAIDVYEYEPPNLDDPLFKLDNVITTPHIAAYTREALRKMDITVAEDVINVLTGKPPKYPVNKPR